MDAHASHYQVLGLDVSASADTVKAAFRRLAQLHHPDHNANLPASTVQFILINEAWRILGDPISRRDYDNWLAGSSAGRTTSVAAAQPAKAPGSDSPGTPPAERPRPDNREVLDRFNFLLWDIDDQLAPNHRPALRDRAATWPANYVERHILTILAFFDHWVLGPGGFPDHFQSARQMEPSDPREIASQLGAWSTGIGHQAYVNALDYFYDVRKRMDRFQTAWAHRDLSVVTTPNGLRMIDCILEAQNLAVHTLGMLMQDPALHPRGIPPYPYSHPDFLA